MKLAAAGRAFDNTRPYTDEEMEGLLALTSEGVERLTAAEYVRNGIYTMAGYEKAVEKGFELSSLEEIRLNAITSHQEKVRKDLGIKAEKEEDEDEDEDDDLPSREDLEKEATELEISFTSRMKDKTIFDKIEEAKA